jgi:hypothetical protein
MWAFSVSGFFKVGPIDGGTEQVSTSERLEAVLKRLPPFSKLLAAAGLGAGESWSAQKCSNSPQLLFTY